MSADIATEKQSSADEFESRILQIEGLVQALARSWLYLAAGMEIQGHLDSGKLEQAMLSARWPDTPLDPYAQRTMSQLVDQLAAARESRARRARYQSTGRDE